MINKIFFKNKKPIIKKITPKILSLFSGVFLINLSIFFIFDGKMATNKPSIKKSNPIAVIRSCIENFYLVFIALPKNLKNSLSGDKTKDVSPPIKAVSYDCIAL